MDGCTVLHDFATIACVFAVKKIFLFLYNGIHTLSTRCAQVIHRPGAGLPRVLKFASEAGCRMQSPLRFAAIVPYDLRPGRSITRWPERSNSRVRQAQIRNSAR